MSDTLKDKAEQLFRKTVPSYHRLVETRDALYETFVQQQYRWLTSDLRPGTTAIDIGANIGDSAIYLAMCQEIKRVHAYGPYPYAFNQAVRNVRGSGLAFKVKLYNAGIYDRCGFISIPQKLRSGLGSQIKNYKAGRRIRIYDLNTVLKGKKNVILKIDVEQSEYRIINPNINLDNVYRIQMEYHRGVQQLANILKCKGFAVSLAAHRQICAKKPW